jgi:hypothetical protein
MRQERSPPASAVAPRANMVPWVRDTDSSKVASPKPPPALAPPPHNITLVRSPTTLPIPSTPHVPIPSPPEVGASTPDVERPRRPLEGDGSRELGPADLDLRDESPTLPTVYLHPSFSMPTVQAHAPLSSPTMLHPELRHRVSGVPARADVLGVRRPAGVEKPIQAARPLVAPSECPLVAPSEYPLSLCAPVVYSITW